MTPSLLVPRRLSNEVHSGVDYGGFLQLCTCRLRQVQNLSEMGSTPELNLHFQQESFFVGERRCRFLIKRLIPRDQNWE